MQILMHWNPQVFFMVLARVAAMMGAIIFFGSKRINARIRMAMILAVTIAVMPLVSSSWGMTGAEVPNLSTLLFVIAGEVSLGIALGLICNLCVMVFVLAGQLASTSASFGMAQEVDPLSGISNALLGELLQMTFFMVVLLSNAHLMLIQLLAESVQVLPPGFAWLKPGFMDQIVGLGTAVFEFGVKLALPTAAASMILSAALGLIARMAPDFNILFLSLPFRLYTGLAVFGLTLRFGGRFFDRIIDLMLAHCAYLLRG